jgi:hypothetical protein
VEKLKILLCPMILLAELDSDALSYKRNANVVEAGIVFVNFNLAKCGVPIVLKVHANTYELSFGDLGIVPGRYTISYRSPSKVSRSSPIFLGNLRANWLLASVDTEA